MTVLGLLSDITSLLAGALPEDKWLQGFPGLLEARISGTLRTPETLVLSNRPRCIPVNQSPQLLSLPMFDLAQTFETSTASPPRAAGLTGAQCQNRTADEKASARAGLEASVT